MANAAPQLPTRFPCWCRATYSWGGESKRDLGFIEGDLIECLNAGDGSWWMGRLRRNKQTGLFPSNFVQVLDAAFVPVSRGTSPMPSPHGSITSPPKKSKTFRKPFQAYSSVPLSKSAVQDKPAPTADLASPPRNLNPDPARQLSYVSDSRLDSGGRSHLSPSRSPERQLSFVSSSDGIRRRTTHLSRRSQYMSEESPEPDTFDGQNAFGQYALEHDTVGMAEEDTSFSGASPPPPPPPHRVTYKTSQTSRESHPTHQASSSDTTPPPRSPRPIGQTPSPLRDAMDDVMSSLQDMQLQNEEENSQHSKKILVHDPWSPEAFDELQSRERTIRRPRSSLGIALSHQDGAKKHVYADTCEARQMQHEIPDHREAMSTPYDRTRREGHEDHDDNGGSMLQHRSQRPMSSMGAKDPLRPSTEGTRRLRARKSAYELGRSMLDRTFSQKTSATSSSSGIDSNTSHGTSSTQRTSQSIMSGHSAGKFSATSAGSLARRKFDHLGHSAGGSSLNARYDNEARDHRGADVLPENSSRHHPNQQSSCSSDFGCDRPTSAAESSGLLGGLNTPKHRKSGFFRKLVDSAKAGAASTRGTIAEGRIEQQRSPIKSLLPAGVTAISSNGHPSNVEGSANKTETEWMQVRRDINRSNSLSRNERAERVERCQMMSYPVIASVNELHNSTDGDESADGLPVHTPTNYASVNLQLVDKGARFVNSLPAMTNAINLAQSYVCRPYRSDIQRLRAIFTWVSEKIAWEDDFEGDVDTKRLIQTRRGCSEEIAVLVYEMCTAVNLHVEIVRGFLKTPGEAVQSASSTRPNHWWNAVIVDGVWRLMDCSLANPTNPKRASYSTVSSQMADAGFFLARPMEICYTHQPTALEQQHLCPPVDPEILAALPCACPSYFNNGLQLVNYDTSLFRIDNLELVQIQFNTPSDVECVAEVEARSYSYDADGDVFESGETTSTRALAQVEWVEGCKRYTVKAHLPSDEGLGTLKIYAGKRGLMHSIKDNPHPLAFAIPIIHTGKNPPYEFLLRHPTPHALRHDLYVSQPQCRRLALNNTFVFAVRQHPSSLGCFSPMEQRSTSPLPTSRPSSAMSMVSVATSDYFSQTGSSTSGSASTHAVKQEKPAKLAVQAPSGKIIRMARKTEHGSSNSGETNGSTWETIIKVGERGTWRGLVLADRSARWCVFSEWDCY